MTVLTEFFKGSENQMGIFAPLGYIIALFPDPGTAKQAERKLLDAGFPQDTVISVPGEDVVELADEHAKHSGLGSLLMQGLSRIFETEEVYAEHDLKLASEGAGFLAVHVSSDAQKKDAWKLLEPLHPLVARHYSRVGVEHFAGET